MQCERISDVQFGAAGQRPLLLDMYRPVVSPGRAMPALVWLHGGAWAWGDKETVPHLLPALAERGIVVVSVAYRLSGEAPFPAQIHDVKAVVRWLRANAETYGLDPERIGVAGHSAGGHLAALLGTTGHVPELEGSSGSPGFSSRVQAAVPISAPIDALRSGAPAAPPGASPWEWLVGGPLHEHPELVRMTNPLTFVTSDAPPFLIVHGVEDETVPVGQSDLLDEALRASGVAVEYLRVAGGLHHFAQAIVPNEEQDAEYWTRVIDQLLPAEIEAQVIRFLEEHLAS